MVQTFLKHEDTLENNIRVGQYQKTGFSSEGEDRQGFTALVEAVFSGSLESECVCVCQEGYRGHLSQMRMF